MLDVLYVILPVYMLVRYMLCTSSIMAKFLSRIPKFGGEVHKDSIVSNEAFQGEPQMKTVHQLSQSWLLF